MGQLLVICLLVLAPEVILAGDKSIPFSQTTITIELGSRQGRNIFDYYWQSGYLSGLSLTMPFYFGEVQGGFQSTDFNATEFAQSDYNSLFVFVGWGAKSSFSSRFSVGGLIRIGMDVMTFPNVEGYAAHESEIAIEYGPNIGYSLSTNWEMNASWQQKRIYSFRRIRLQYIGVSLGRTFTTPSWLLEIME